MPDPTDLDTLVSEPVERSSVRRWVLLDGNRLVLAGIVSGGVFLASALLAAVGLISVTEPGPLTALAGGLVGGTLPFITIVLAINQLVLSQELGWVGTLRERMDEMRTFRRDVESLTDTSVVSPAPAEFLRTLVERTDRLTRAFADRCEDVPDSDLHADIAELTELMAPRSARVARALERAEFGTFSALSASLDYNTGEYLYLVRRLRTTHSDSIPDDADAVLDDVAELLAALDVARQYFKTLYTQHELASLSRLLLYAGLPALLGGGFVVLSYDIVLGLGLGRPAVIAFVAATVTTLFLPFSVLLAYTLRIATLASHTADFGPFVPRDTLTVGDADD